MLSKLRLIFDSYCYWNTDFAGASMQLAMPDGSTIGYIDQFDISGGQARIAGWSLMDGLSIVTSQQSVPVRRRLQRRDVSASLGEARMLETKNTDARVGFNFELEWHDANAVLCLSKGNIVYHWPLPGPTKSQKAAVARNAWVPFGLALARSIPKIVRHRLSGRRVRLDEELREQLGLKNRRQTMQSLSRAFFDRKSGHQMDKCAGITVIMPVYNALEALREALERLVANTDLPWHLILIEDASTDPEVLPWIRSWAKAQGDRVTLLENTSNLGFVRSVNRGLELAEKRDEHVVFLNSDAFVPKNWASRLIQPILDDATVASVTPMSNDATIFSVPWIADSIRIPDGAVDQIDLAASRLSPDARAEAPCGVGFCMALNRAALEKVPSLDTVFGRGYGEEVDWCQKLVDRGMKHVGTGNLFVEHRSGSSFGIEIKSRAIADAGRIISRRYPSFDAQVQTFIKDDPLFTARLHLSIACAAAKQSAPLSFYLAHSLGGGAEHWLNGNIRSAQQQGQSSVVIRVGGNKRFAIELHMDEEILIGETDDVATLMDMVGAVEKRNIVYSCGVGDLAAIELPQILCDLATGRHATLDVLFHDYLPISPSFNLLNSEGVYRGVPLPDDPDPAHQPKLTDGSQGALKDWRDAWGRLISRSDNITVFSDNSREIVASAWPNARDKIQVRPHNKRRDVPVLTPYHAKDGAPASLGILGSIGDVKGARFVSYLAWYLRRKNIDLNIVVIGEFDQSFSLPPDVVVTGRYDFADLEAITVENRIAAWLMPSVCPETFSFTTHEMLATGLPVFAFDVGAQGDAVAAAPNGQLVEQEPQSVVAAFFEQNHSNKRAV